MAALSAYHASQPLKAAADVFLRLYKQWTTFPVLYGLEQALYKVAIIGALGGQKTFHMFWYFMCSFGHYFEQQITFPVLYGLEQPLYRAAIVRALRLYSKASIYASVALEVILSRQLSFTSKAHIQDTRHFIVLLYIQLYT